MKPCPADPTTCSCRLCWLFLHDDAYNRLWGGLGIPECARKSMIDRVKLTCIHLGERQPDKPECNCPPTYACALHGQCRKTGGGIDALKICMHCQDYQCQA